MLKTDIRGQQLLAGVSECEFGQANLMAIADFGAATMCDYDKSGAAGVIGLGFDYLSLPAICFVLRQNISKSRIIYL